MDLLKSILQQIFKNAPQYEEKKLEIQIFESWSRVVGERTARHCHPLKLIDDGTLLVGAESSVWLQSLRYLEAQILDKFEKELKVRKIKQLRYKLVTPSTISG